MATSTNNKSNARQDRVTRGVVAVVAALVIAFCGWSMSQYVQGRDPLAFALGSDALQTTSEAKEQAKDQAQGQAKDQPKSEDEAKDESKAKPAAGSDKSNKSSAAGTGAKKTASKDGAAANGTSNGSAGQAVAQDVAEHGDGQQTVTQEVVYYEDVADQPAQQATQAQAESPVPQPEQPAAPQTITISLSVDGGAGASSATLSLQPGATALDALYAAGVGVDSIPNPFGSGTWVTSIGGLAEDAGHGWTYRVNGDLPGVMSDLYELQDGDSVLWQYV